MQTKIYYLNKYFPNNHFWSEDKEIIETILAMIQNGDDLDIRKVAEKNYISASSITRLVKRSACANYKEFIFQLKKSLERGNANSSDDYPYAIFHATIDELDNFFQTAFQSNKIYLYGEGFCQFIVDYLHRKLLLQKIFPIDLNGVEISHVSDGSPYTLFIFSHSGENKNGLQKIRECKEFGGQVVAFTATENSSYTKTADISFVVQNGHSHLDFENSHLNLFFGNSINLLEHIIARTMNLAQKSC